MNRKLQRSLIVAVSMTAVLSLSAIGSRAMAELTPTSNWKIDNIHYLIFQKDTTKKDPDDKFKIIVAATHPLIRGGVNPQIVLSALSTTRDGGTGNSSRKDFPAIRKNFDTSKNRVVAIFEFRRKKLPAGFDAGDGSGSGAYTFTLQDLNGTPLFVDDTSPLIAVAGPDPIFPTEAEATP